MLEMGVLSPVAAASAAAMILYTSAAASAAYYVFGLIPEDYGTPLPPSIHSSLTFSRFPFLFVLYPPHKDSCTRLTFPPSLPPSLSPLHSCLPPLQGLFFFCWGFLCTALGQLVVTHMLRRYKKESLIVLSIGAVITLSALMMSFQAIVNYVQDPVGVMRMSSLCD